MMITGRVIPMKRILVMLLISTFAAAAMGDVGSLTDAQKRKLISEAQVEYDRAASVEATDFPKARAAYENAAEKFQVVASAGTRSGWLYYNLANAYLKSGNLGLAIANYRHAEQYIGEEPRLVANLDYARGLCASQLEGPREQGWSGALASINRRLNAKIRLWIGVAGWSVLWLGVLGSMFLKRVKWRMVMISGATVCVLMAASLAWEYSILANDYQGVVTAKETIIRKGNGDAYAPLFKESLCEGTEFSVLDERRGWLEIKLGDGKIGWIPKTDAVLVTPRKMF